MTAPDLLAVPVPPARRRFAPNGMGSVAIGVAASGICAYAFLAVTARWFGPTRYAPLATFWSATFLIGPGCFANLEKEAGRLIAGGLAVDDQRGPVLRRTAILGAAVTAVLIAGFLAAGGPAVHRLFAGDGVLLAAFLLALVTIALQYLSYGLLAGNSSFRAYGVLAAGEGVFRLVGGLALIAIGVSSLGAYGWAVAAAPAVAVLVVIPSLRRSSGRGLDVSLGSMARSTGWLLVGTLFTAVLVGSGPITVQLLGGNHHPAETARFLSGLVVVRVPLFLYTSAVATLLPALSGHVARGEDAAFRHTLQRLVLAVLALGALGVGGAALIGGPVLGAVFGSGYRLPAGDLAALAGTVAALLVATTLAVGLMARDQARVMALAWAGGVVVMVGVTAIVRPLLERVEMGLLAGSAVAAVLMVPPLLRRVAAPTG